VCVNVRTACTPPGLYNSAEKFVPNVWKVRLSLRAKISQERKSKWRRFAQSLFEATSQGLDPTKCLLKGDSRVDFLGRPTKKTDKRERCENIFKLQKWAAKVGHQLRACAVSEDREHACEHELYFWEHKVVNFSERPKSERFQGLVQTTEKYFLLGAQTASVASVFRHSPKSFGFLRSQRSNVW
jgi:hypothetical protein